MRTCFFCRRWFKNKQAVRSHLRRCAKWLLARDARLASKPTWQGSNKRREVYVYAIQADLSKRVKIGIAGDVDRRLAELQAQQAEPLKLLAAVSFSSRRLARTRETALHVVFSSQRLHGEWFMPSTDLVDAVQVAAFARAPLGLLPIRPVSVPVAACVLGLPEWQLQRMLHEGALPPSAFVRYPRCYRIDLNVAREALINWKGE